MKSLVLILSFLFVSCTTAPDATLYCTEVIKVGEQIKVYWSEYPNIMNTDINLNIDGLNGFYILELSKSPNGWYVESQKDGLINFENGIVSLLNGC